MKLTTRIGWLMAALLMWTVGPVGAQLVGQFGILDTTANGGINPATGAPWQVDDEYRLAFVTSATHDGTSSTINVYNDFVQGLADAAGLGACTPWM